MSMIKATRSSNGREEGEITLAVDPERMTGVINGCLWFGVTDGKPQFMARFNPLPDAVEDEVILPFWSGGQSIKMIDLTEEASFSAHFDLQHLCGYNYTPEKYRAEAEKLESFGFVCLRSKRGQDGRYWEIWRLLGYWSAKGVLREFCETEIRELKTDAEKIKAMVRWLCQHCSFGTLDVSSQRAAMTMDD